MNTDNPSVIRTNISNIIKKLLRYYDLGYILNNLESLIVLPVPFKNIGETMEEYNKNKSIYNQTSLEAEKTFLDFENELKQREAIFKYLRTIDPDFGLNMNKKISPEEHNRYLQHLRNLTREISKLSFFFKEREKNYTELLLSKKDVLSNIIDSPDNTEMANIEDRFVLSELEKLNLKKLNDQDILENILKLKEDLRQRISKHQVYDKLNNKGNKIILKLGKTLPPLSTTDSQR